MSCQQASKPSLLNRWGRWGRLERLSRHSSRRRASRGGATRGALQTGERCPSAHPHRIIPKTPRAPRGRAVIGAPTTRSGYSRRLKLWWRQKRWRRAECGASKETSARNIKRKKNELSPCDVSHLAARTPTRFEKHDAGVDTQLNSVSLPAESPGLIGHGGFDSIRHPPTAANLQR